MAKKNETATARQFTFGDLVANASDISQEMILNLAGLGFSTKLKNVTAGLKPAIMGESKSANWELKDFQEAAKEMGVSSDFTESNMTPTWREQFATDYAAFIVNAEFDAIMDGTANFGSTRGPRLKGIEWFINEVAKTAWPKIKAKVPGYTKEKDGELFESFKTKNRAIFLPEAERRMAEASKVEEMDLAL